MTPAHRTILAWLERNPPAGREQIAAAHGIAPKTASVHLNALQRAGLAHSTGIGPTSRWKLGQRPMRPGDVDVCRYDMRPIEQCPSIWAYARRIAAQVRSA